MAAHCNFRSSVAGVSIFVGTGTPLASTALSHVCASIRACIGCSSQPWSCWMSNGCPWRAGCPGAPLFSFSGFDAWQSRPHCTKPYDAPCSQSIQVSNLSARLLCLWHVCTHAYVSLCLGFDARCCPSLGQWQSPLLWGIGQRTPPPARLAAGPEPRLALAVAPAGPIGGLIRGPFGGLVGGAYSGAY